MRAADSKLYCICTSTVKFAHLKPDNCDTALVGHMALLGSYAGLRLVWICPHRTLISERNEVLNLTERGLIQPRLYCVLWECCW